ncbi:MAG: tRNA (N6-isopentenyl adenosine(37)-C2)-methylthiotransferase MiaB [Planctomycetes bacterium]|nr:tRNA (N6-isopentenyl adenosine(37)-C2)-methylthiotransferase MiaB [Planctomycetota bacterium]
MTLPRVRTRNRYSEVTPSTAPALHVVTFGCQMNKYDSLLVEGRFRAAGYRLTEEVSTADVVLFNTCSVRDHAEERVYSWLGEIQRVKAERPDLVVGMMGCMAQRAQGDIFSRARHVDIVCGTRRIQDLPELVEDLRQRRRAPECPSQGERVLAVEMDGDVALDRSGEPWGGGLTSYLTVMRGCDLNCTFCIVPTVRGRVRSRPIAELVGEASWMVAGGAKVLTLLGQTVNAYGEDLSRPGAGEKHLRGRQGRPGLADLLYELQEIDGLERIRLITLHPSYVTTALARAIGDCDKVDRFLPLPAQSGSDDCLRRMKRGYTTELYRRRVELLRREVPDIELGSDWIVGFPGETEDEFDETLSFAEEIEFAQGYVFQYDPRPGTRAHERVDDVPRAVKKERNQRLLKAVEAVALNRMGRWVGREVKVFVEEVGKAAGTLRARTHHNLPVRLPGDTAWIGSERSVRIDAASPYGLTGRVPDSKASR